MTGIFVVGLGSMILLVIGAWFATLIVAGTASLSEDAIGDVPAYYEDSNRFSFLSDIGANNGQVAGVVADASVKETELRNSAMDWLGLALESQGLDSVYRDGVLDRNAQNQARFYADQCLPGESNWEQSIGLRVDEGYTTSFSEASFVVSGIAFASELPTNQTDYARLFTLYDAAGVGVAELAASCGQDGFVMVYHLAGVRS